MPELVIDDSVTKTHEVKFDIDAYMEYLVNRRGVPEGKVQELLMRVVGEDEISGCLAYFLPANYSDTGRDTLTLIASRLEEGSRYAVGSTLRHETEHFIQATTKENLLKAVIAGRIATTAIWAAGAGVVTAAAFYPSLFESWDELPDHIARPVGAALGAIAAGAAAGEIARRMIWGLNLRYNVLEFGANIAQIRYRSALPDGTLTIGRKLT